MKNKLVLTLGVVLSFALGIYANHLIGIKSNNNSVYQKDNSEKTKKQNTMKLGAFSISLSVKDLLVSKEFYENLGFTVLGGNIESNYLILKNENAIIGLFQGMFEGNIITFNPGWDENGENIKTFNDVREIQQNLKSNNIALLSEADEKTSGPASIMLTDPDGNLILIDQHR